MARRARTTDQEGKKVTDLKKWKTSKEQGYSRENVYRGAVDNRGHSTTIRVNVPPDVYRQANVIAASQEWPAYETTADVVRDGLVHELHYLMNEGKRKRLSLNVTLARVEARRIQEEEEELRSAVEEWEKLLRDRDEESRGDLIEYLRPTLELMPKEAEKALGAVLDRYSGREE